MLWCVRVVLGLLACSACAPAVDGREPPAKEKAEAKATVELRWVESRRIDGVTEAKGFQCGCDPKDVAYAHKKPALVLTAAEVARVEMKNVDLSKSGLSAENYTVTIHLTKDAREKLAATADGNDMRRLTVVVDGKTWGVHRYEKDKDKPFVPAQARAETFAPGVGMFSSRAEAQRLVDALK